ncbi:ZN398 protein, partial [Eurystomus gularis]|nr:ZN398 protein [Eurystomus gularis]
SSISLWTVVAAVQAVERSVDAHASRLLNLEHRTVTTEQKYFDCKKAVVEFGNQLESKLAALGTLVQEYGLLQRRLENMENLLKNRNFWILQLPPGGKLPKVPAAFKSNITRCSAQEGDNLEEWQREVYRNMLREWNESLISMDDVISKPDLLSQLQRETASCDGDRAAPRDLQAEPKEAGATEEPGAAEEPGATEEPGAVEKPGATEDVELTDLSLDDSIIQIKQEEELCAAEQQEEEEEAGEAPEKPCPEQAFYEPEASSQAKQGKEACAAELPGAEGEDL